MNYSRKDSTKRSLLISNKDLFNVLGKELKQDNKFKEYRRLFDETCKEFRVLQDTFPVHLDFELNFVCNIKCSFCIHTYDNKKIKEWGDKSKSIDFDTFKRVVDEGVKKGLRSIGFNGTNEPLTIKNLCEYISYAKEAGVIDIMFNTNGLLLTKEKSLEIINSGVTRIMISVDAFSKETYEKDRIGGDYELLIKNITEFLKIREELKKTIPMVRLSFVAHSNNVHELKDFVNYWKDKVDFFSLQSLRDAFMYDEDKSKEFRDYFKFNNSPDEIQSFFKCPQPFVRMLIRNNGDVVPCCSFYGMKLVVGNIYDSSIEEIWNSKEINEIREKVNDPSLQPEACKRCRSGSTFKYDIEDLIFG